MPKRKVTTKRNRVSSHIIAQLRAAVHEGCPWLNSGKIGNYEYKSDLLFLVSGCFYFGDFIQDRDDTEGAKAIWWELREDVLEEHIKRRPGTRPWAWWELEEREPRRLVEVINRFPACPNGTPIYEPEREYLERFGLLTEFEKTLFSKYGDCSVVRVAQGERSKCQECWNDLYREADEISFDVKRAVLPHDAFAIPDELVFYCKHNPYLKDGLFDFDSY